MIGIYLRVSTEKQDEGMQINAIKRCIGEEEYTKARIYKDHGMTGTITERPDYQRMLADIIIVPLDKIVTYEFSRLWRDLEEQNKIFKQFKKYGVQLQSATEGFVETPEQELSANVVGAVNQHYIARLKIRIKDGISAKKKDIEEGRDTWKGRGKDKKMRKRPMKRTAFKNIPLR